MRLAAASPTLVQLPADASLQALPQRGLLTSSAAADLPAPGADSRLLSNLRLGRCRTTRLANAQRLLHGQLTCSNDHLLVVGRDSIAIWRLPTRGFSRAAHSLGTASVMTVHGLRQVVGLPGRGALVTLDAEGVLALRGLARTATLWQVRLPQGSKMLAVSSDEQLLAAVDGTQVTVYELPALRPAATWEMQETPVTMAFSHGSRRLLLALADRLVGIDLDTGGVVWTLDRDMQGTRLVVIGPQQDAVVRHPNGVTLTVDAAGNVVSRWHDSPQATLLPIRAGHWALRASNEGLSVVDSRGGAQMAHLSRRPGTRQIAAAPHGRWVVEACADGTVTVYDFLAPLQRARSAPGRLTPPAPRTPARRPSGLT